MSPLPPYDRTKPCPKCRFLPGTTTYHKGHHGPDENCDAAALVRERRREVTFLPDPDVGNWLAEEKTDPESIAQRAAKREAIERLWEAIRAVPEHFERECPNCKYVWAEAVA